jgi:hypothetical protein
MIPTSSVLKGVVHGRIIELETEPGWPEGQHVTVLVRPVLAAGEGVRQSAGGWADAAEEIESWLNEVQRGRQQDRTGSS